MTDWDVVLDVLEEYDTTAAIELRAVPVPPVVGVYFVPPGMWAKAVRVGLVSRDDVGWIEDD